jgi:tRNA-2-methylthio-N6-dimethylallyladenosine synthase
MCSFCVVPFTRGRERSRDAASIVNECRELVAAGYKEVTLLGQNVDSYYYVPQTSGSVALKPENNLPHSLRTKGMADMAKASVENVPVTFARLLKMVAEVSPQLRVRFSTSHPKDITDDVLYTIAEHSNICNYIHLPLQSGSTRVLGMMNRNYSREWYAAKINRIREIIPDCAISSDIIAGFCTETEEDHLDTLQLMEFAQYEMSYMFYYSERPGTLAQRRYADDVPLITKKRRLQEIVDLQGKLSHQSNLRDLGKTFTVLIEGDSKKNDRQWRGRSGQNKVIVFDKGVTNYKPGDYVDVKVVECTQATLIGEVVLG